MNKIILIMTLLATNLNAKTIPLNSKNTQTQFQLIHFMGREIISGKIDEVTGVMNYDDQEQTLQKILAEIPLRSLQMENKKFSSQFKSNQDYLDVANHPKAVFASSEPVKLAESFQLKGRLTLKGITKDVSFRCQRNKESILAKLIIKRSDFNMGWSSPLPGKQVVEMFGQRSSQQLSDEVTILVTFKLPELK
jgi:polyisoprenoid-binding protein YceI